RGRCGGNQFGHLAALGMQDRGQPGPLLGTRAGEAVDREGPAVEPGAAARLDRGVGFLLARLADAPQPAHSAQPGRRRLHLACQAQEIPSASPSARANPVMLETPTTGSYWRAQGLPSAVRQRCPIEAFWSGLRSVRCTALSTCGAAAVAAGFGVTAGVGAGAAA